MKKQIDACISQVENDVSVGVVQNPQNGVTEKSVEETDKSETKQGSAGVEDNPQICVTEKSVEETDKQEKVPDEEKVFDEVTDKSETKKLVRGLKITHKFVLWKSQLRRKIKLVIR